MKRIGCLATLMMWTIGLPIMVIYHLIVGSVRGRK